MKKRQAQKHSTPRAPTSMVLGGLAPQCPDKWGADCGSKDCPRCLRNYYTECELCGEDVYEEDAVYRDDMWVCPECDERSQLKVSPEDE